jgi:hypothetical protein
VWSNFIKVLIGTGKKRQGLGTKTTSLFARILLIDRKCPQMATWVRYRPWLMQVAAASTIQTRSPLVVRYRRKLVQSDC